MSDEGGEDPQPKGVRLKYLLDPNHNKYQRSKRHELRLAKELGGRRLTNSGGAPRSRWDQRRSQGGDIESADFLFEHKRTVKDSIALKRDWLEKVRAGAARLEKTPALIITFEGRGDPLDLVVLRLEDFQRLTGSALRPARAELR